MKKLFKITALLLAICTLCLVGCKQPQNPSTNPPKNLSLYAPDGAPALAISKMIADKDNLGIESVNYNVVSSEEIGTQMTSGNADVIILPVNQASISYKENSSDPYKLVAVITHGNLYIVSKMQITDLAVLKGNVIGIAGNQNQVPDLTLKAILKANGLQYQVVEKTVSGAIKMPDEDKVGLFYGGAPTIKTMLGSSQLYVGLLPEPAVSIGNTAQMNRLALHDLYDGQAKSFPQAVLMVKNSVLKASSSLVETLKQKMSASFTFAINNAEQAISAVKSVYESTSLLPAMTGEMFERCSFSWQGAKDAKESVKNYLKKIKEVSSVGLGISVAQEVTDEFFYI